MGYTCTYTSVVNVNDNIQINYFLFKRANYWVIMMDGATKDNNDIEIYCLKQIIYVHNFQGKHYHK